MTQAAYKARHLICVILFAWLVLFLTSCGGSGSSPSVAAAISSSGSVPTVTGSLPGASASLGMLRAAAAPDGSSASALVMMVGTFDITVPVRAGLTCKIDTDGDGVYEYIRTNCTSFQQVHEYRLGSPLGVNPKLVMLDSTNTILATYVWHARLDEDTLLPNQNRAYWDKVGVTYPATVNCNQAVAIPVTAATIQAAINAAATAAGTAGYCYATIPVGTHTVSTRVTLKSRVILRGTQTAGATTASTVLNANINDVVIAATGGVAASVAYTGADLSAYKGRNYMTVPASQASAVQTLLAAQTNGYLYANFAAEAEYLRPIVAGQWHPAQTMQARLPFPDLFSTPIDYVNSVADTCTGIINSARSSYWCIRDSADYSVGQWVKIVGVQDNRLVIEGFFNESYPENNGLNYRLRVFTSSSMLDSAGVEDLAITRTDSSNKSVISFDGSVNSYVRRVDIQLNYREAIAFNNSLNCEVSKTYIHNARVRGGNGQGYGVAIQNMSTQCLVTDNVMTSQRHAISLQFGANGNVVSDNYAPDGQDDTTVFGIPAYVRKADISVHGHYAHMNLIEGNYVGSLMVSDWHGRSPFHTVYRNRVTNGVRHHFASWGTAFVDNVIVAGYGGVAGIGGWTSLTVDATMAFAPINVKPVICFRNNNASGVADTAYDTIAGSGITNLCNNTIAPVVTPPNSYFRSGLTTPTSITTNAARARALSGNYIW